MDDLASFLRARLDDDEAYARNAFGDHNDAGAEWCEQWSGALNIGDAEELVITNDSQVSRFMARWDPARVLAEVEALRRILGEYEAQRDKQEANGARFIRLTKQSPTPYEELTPVKTHGWELGGRVGALGSVIRLLALPYADHPEYRDEWRL